jgi:preprotein translocase subunit SecE
MGQPQTQAVLVPPPPAPPAGSIAAANPNPSREPSGTSQYSFLTDVLMELKCFVWPAAETVWASTSVTIGLLALLTLFICCLNMLAAALSVVMGVR